MPDTPYLIAAAAVLAVVVIAVVIAVRAAGHARVRRGGSHAATTDAPPAPAATPSPPAASELAEARAELAAARSEVAELTERLRQGQLPSPVGPAPVAHADGRHVEIFVNLSRRLQSLVHREIKLLDSLENEVEDPDLLKGLFQVDHLATRIRRHAENLAVLGGSVSRRQWSRPVALTEVLRSAIAEVEHYSRVKLVPPIEGRLPGHAVASVIHLIAELIENATMFAPPHTQVLLRAQQVTAGVAIEVEDRGLGMQRDDLHRVNQLLVNPDDTNLDDLLRDGRIGLYVVSVIARQHGIVVQLQPNIYGGIQAVVILPQLLIGAPEAAALEAAAVPVPAPEVPARQVAAQRPLLAKRVPLQQRILARERALNPTQDTTEFALQPLRPATPPARATPAHAAPVSVVPALAGNGHVLPPVVPRQTATATVPGQQPAPTPARPPLPRRHSQTHMAPQLQLGPPRPPTEPPAEHDPGLMASFMSGVSQGEADPPVPDVLADPPHRS